MSSIDFVHQASTSPDQDLLILRYHSHQDQNCKNTAISGRCQGHPRRDSLSAEGADCWLTSRPSVAIACSA